LYIYAPKRTSNINLIRPEKSFNQMATFVSGIFSVQQLQYDDQYVLVSINLARELFEYQNNTVSAIELKLNKNADSEIVKAEISKLIGNKYLIKNRYEQQESFFKIMKIEKWITFLILCFILLIASFNVIGSLSMLIIEKKQDIETLRSIGANNLTIRYIFLFEGWLIAIVGSLSGIILGSILCIAQEKIGFLKLGSGYVVDSYPVVTNVTDVLLVFITVLLMGFVAAWYPTRNLNRDF
jgi:lipoprotein-releasing system permease protein